MSKRTQGPARADRQATVPQPAGQADLHAALQASEILSEQGAGKEILKKLTPHVSRAFGVYGWGTLLAGDPLPDFAVFMDHEIPDDEMALICSRVIDAYNEFAEHATDGQAEIQVLNKKNRKQKGADVVMAWQMFGATGFIGITFLIGDARTNPTAQQIRIFSLLANQLAATIEAGQLNRKLHSQVSMGAASLEDAATGLPTRKRFLSQLDLEIKRASRYRHELACLVLEFPALKTLKRKYGEKAYEKAQKQLANALRNSIREVDLAAQFSQSEFALLLPDTSSAGASVIARRLIHTMSEQSLVPAKGKPAIVLGGESVRAGIAQAKRKSENARGLLQRIRTKLSQTRKAGKTGQVVVASARA